ncbi:MAG: RagB/SusD family nutrient uptake outer membrane protein [Chitinophagaceae bacterium]|nr:RagB/SusD family nutrient uptake outer membrane protein [Chitinophagaceae bacterium]
MSIRIFPLYFVLILLIQSLAGCRKLVATDTAPGLIESVTVFANESTALSAISGVYVHMRGSNLLISNGGLSLYTGLAADEIYNTASNSTADPFFKNTIPANSSTVASNFWSTAYANIYKINAILEGISKSSGISEPFKKQVRGEMKAVRALYYFYLVNLFGDVPLVLNTDYRLNSTLARTPQQQVYAQIISDLGEAEELLPVTYVSANKARPNHWTAIALLSRVYLYLEQWEKAEEAATAIINSGMYSLVTNLNNVFTGNSSETIWQVTSDIGNTAEGANYIPSSSTVRPTYAISPYLLNDAELTDLRRTSWMKSNTVSGVPYHYPYKYKVRSGTPITEYNIVLRLSEQYLIRAEAKAMQNKVAEGCTDLNVTRSRAQLGAIYFTSRDSLRTAIQQERRIELFSEWGHRWLDLKRTQTIDAILATRKAPGWESTDALFPIPLAQLQINVFLQQNPGY